MDLVLDISKEYFTTEEIINNEAILMPRPNINHSIIIGNIYENFKSFLKNKNCRIFTEVEVYLDKNVVVPDILVVCDIEKIGFRGIYGSPDLVVEVLSFSNINHDKKIKFEIYEKYKIPEYWIVDPNKKEVYVYNLKNDKYILHEIESSEITSPTKHFKVLIDEIFKDMI